MAPVAIDQAQDIAERTAALAKLAESKNHLAGEGQLETYLEDLADVPTPLLLAAIVRLRRALTYAFPSSADVRAMADQVQRDEIDARAQKALPPAPGERTFQCADCQDEPSAWRHVWCDGRGPHRDAESGSFERDVLGHALQTCERIGHHGPHGYVVRCGCHRAPWREERRRHLAQKFSENRKSDYRKPA